MKVLPDREYQSIQVLERAVRTIDDVSRTLYFFCADTAHSANCFVDKSRSRMRRAVLVKGRGQESGAATHARRVSNGMSTTAQRRSTGLAVRCGFCRGRNLLWTSVDFGLDWGVLSCRLSVTALDGTMQIAAGTVGHHPTTDATSAQCRSRFEWPVGAAYRAPWPPVHCHVDPGTVRGPCLRSEAGGHPPICFATDANSGRLEGKSSPCPTPEAKLAARWWQRMSRGRPHQTTLEGQR